MDEAATFPERMLCQSAFVLENKCSNATLVSKNATCNTTCEYSKDGKPENNVNSTSACVCGKNNNGDKYCNYGTDSAEFLADLSLRKRYLNKENKGCHTTERFSPCRSAIMAVNTTSHAKFDYKKRVKNFTNEMVLNNVQFQNVDPASCILPVLGTWNRDIIPTDSRNACPMYRCGDEKTFCSDSFNPNYFDSRNISITLNNICDSTQTCNIPDLTEVYSKETVKAKCITNDAPKSKFAGESCSNNDDCQNK